MKGKKRKVQYGKVILVSFLSLRNNRGANATQLLSQLSKKENNLFEQKKNYFSKNFVILLNGKMLLWCHDHLLSLRRIPLHGLGWKVLSYMFLCYIEQIRVLLCEDHNSCSKNIKKLWGRNGSNSAKLLQRRWIILTRRIHTCRIWRAFLWTWGMLQK